MSAPDVFVVLLHGLDAAGVRYCVLGGRHVLDITPDVSLFVRPAEDDLPAVTEGLRKLAAAATEMAAALGAHGDAR